MDCRICYEFSEGLGEVQGKASFEVERTVDWYQMI